MTPRPVACGPAPVTRLPGPVPGTCFAGPLSPWPPSLAPPAPRRITPLCSSASLLLRRSQTSRVRASSASTPRLPDADLGAFALRPNPRPPGSRARSFRTCQVLRPRRAERALANIALTMSPSVILTTSAPGTIKLSRLNGWPIRSPADASPTPSRRPTHGSGPMRVANPSPQWTCTTYSLPVSTGAPKFLIFAPFEIRGSTIFERQESRMSFERRFHETLTAIHPAHLRLPRGVTIAIRSER
jgi:hypothetical protein